MTPPKEYTGADVERAIAAVPGTIIANTEPLIAYRDDVISERDCAEIIALAQNRMTRAVVSGEGGGTQSPGRTNTVAWVPHAETPRLFEIASGIAAMVGMPLEHAENYQAIHYTPGTQYRAHFDAYDLQTARGIRTLQCGGQRVTTTLCYLNSVEAGGATRFPKLDLEIIPRPGRLVVFNNCEADTMERSDLALHSGNPVKAGEKWAFNLWFRQYPKTFNPFANTEQDQTY
jgi:prolyl 4-hydroxylase